MVLRLGMWISTLKFLVIQAKKKLAGQPLDNKVIWLTELCTLVGGFADNMYLFYRINTLKFPSARFEKILLRTSCIPTIIIYTVQIIVEFLKCVERSRKEKIP